jgi:hypothetical protein
MQFVLIVWLQGIWLPLHGYQYSDTPLWAGIFMLALTAGFLAAGPSPATCPTGSAPGAWPAPGRCCSAPPSSA